VPRSPAGEPSATPRPPTGFGKGVNSYLNEYVRVADAKAAAFLAATLTVAGLTLRLKPEGSLSQTARWLSLAALAYGMFECGRVLFPRLPRGRMGLIFWEDIRVRTSASLYEEDLKGLDDAAVESEYAAQNWFVSKLLHTKFAAVQRSIIAFFVGAALAILCYLTLP
jgi:hypothetical protein